ncbi:MAG: DUF2953 domain-containing protein [Acutalibacteraceae bacterium]|nr:DUF2953 domain-containing protein [Acutalibacteraceae bacterium]
MTALIIISIIIAFIILLLLIPVNFYIEYDGENTKVKLGYLFLKFYLMPKPEKKKKKQRKQKKKKTPEKPEQEKKKKKEESENTFSKIFKEQGVSGIIEILGEILDIIKGFLSDVSKHILIRKLRIDISAGGNDAFETAMNFGYICDGIYPLIGALSALVTFCHIPDININADFDNKTTTASLFTQIATRPLFLIKAMIFYLFKAFKLYMKITVSDNRSEENK